MKTIKVQVDDDTAEWLNDLVTKYSKGAPNVKGLTVPKLLAQAAFCFADAAGRRAGSWEAEVGLNMLRSSGFIAY